MDPYGGGKLRGMPTPRTDQLAMEGLRLTQFLVEPSCTPSRSAFMTGQYSIRNGLSLATLPGSPNTLSGKAFTMGQLFKNAGYATAIFGKWHLGEEPQSLELVMHCDYKTRDQARASLELRRSGLGIRRPKQLVRDGWRTGCAVQRRCCGELAPAWTHEVREHRPVAGDRS